MVSRAASMRAVFVVMGNASRPVSEAPAVPSMGEPFKLHLKCISTFHQVPEQLPAWARNTRNSESPWAAAQSSHSGSSVAESAE